MESLTDIEITISDLDPDQARDVWASINVIAGAFISDGYNVAYGRDTYTITEHAAEDDE